MDSAIVETFLSWEFVLAALSINAIMTAVKMAGEKHKATGRVMQKGWFQAFVLTPLPLVLGVGIALMGVYDQPDVQHEILTGVASGFLAQFVYAVCKKRAEVATGVDFDGDGVIEQ